MSYARRLQLADKIASAKPRSFERDRAVQELKTLTTKQIQRECRWGWLRKYKPNARTTLRLQIGAIAFCSIVYVGSMVAYALNVMGAK